MNPLALGGINSASPTVLSAFSLPVVTPEGYGAKRDGSTNDSDAFTAALTNLSAIGGGILQMMPGNYAIASASGTITVPNNITIRGAGKGVTTITVTGSSVVSPLFRASNPNNVWFDDFTIHGNSQENTNARAGAIYFLGDVTATGEMSNFGTRNVAFENFKQSYWVYTLNLSAYKMRSPLVYRPTVQSFSGNTLNTAIGFPAGAVAFLGAINNAAATIENPLVIEPDMDGSYIKQAVIFWSGVNSGQVLGGSVRNFGINLGTPDGGGYSILAYNNNSGFAGGPPSNCLVDGVEILNCFSCGVYGVDTTNMWVRNCYITGQSQTGALPYAAVSFNGSSGGIENNRLIDNLHTLILAPNAGGTITTSNNLMSSSVANSVAVKDSISVGFTDANSKIIHNGDTTHMTGASSDSIQIVSSTVSNPVGFVQINGGIYEATQHGIRGYDSSGPGGLLATSIEINGSYIKTLTGGTGILSGFETTTAPISMNDVTLDAASLTTAVVGLDIFGATAVNLNNLILKNKNSGGSGVMFSATGAKGSMSNTQFINCGAALRFSSTDFGTAVPTWSAQTGTFIQNINPNGAGHLHGYTNTSAAGTGTTWTED